MASADRDSLNALAASTAKGSVTLGDATLTPKELVEVMWDYDPQAELARKLAAKGKLDVPAPVEGAKT